MTQYQVDIHAETYCFNIFSQFVSLIARR